MRRCYTGCSIGARWALVAMLFCVVGCGDTLHPGTGRVLFDDDEPVRAGSVELRSLADRQQYAAAIDSSGEFTLAGRDGTVGVPPGEYEAVVVLIVMTEHLAAADHRHGRDVPTRFADYATSGLRTTIDSATSGPIRIVLPTTE